MWGKKTISIFLLQRSTSLALLSTITQSMTGENSNEIINRLIQNALRDPKVVDDDFECSKVFALVSVYLSSPSTPKKKLLSQMKTIYLFQVTNEKGLETSWWVDMKKTGRLLKLNKGSKAPHKPSVIIYVGDKDLVGLATGALNPMKLYAAKRIRVKGNIDSALNVEKILTQERLKLESLPFVPLSRRESERAEKGVWAEMGNRKAKEGLRSKL